MSKLIFREYIGVKPSSTSLRDFPSEIIKLESLEFNFILGFASESYDKDGKGTGIFNETWNVDYFGPEKVKKLKEKYPNVKVVISIGGRDVKTPFNPAEEFVWILAAVKSLKEIIKKYKNQNGNIIDGIDINYEKIESGTDTLRFANCIGQVITELKNDLTLHIDVVSIAPSEKNGSHYRDLYYANKQNINWVNYQFYNQIHAISTTDAFVDIYKNLIKDYSPDKLIPGISTDPLDLETVKVTREIFIAGCIKLKQISLLRGVFLWNANDSAIPPPGQHTPFILEHSLQDILTKKSGGVTSYLASK